MQPVPLLICHSRELLLSIKKIAVQNLQAGHLGFDSWQGPWAPPGGSCPEGRGAGV
jgi:hypothetical protein